jgi:hypothetical protein
MLKSVDVHPELTHLLERLAADDPRVIAYRVWQRTMARIALRDRGTLIATRTKTRALGNVLPKRMALDRLMAEAGTFVIARGV